MERRQFLKLGGMAATTGLIHPPFMPGGEDKRPDKFSETINFTTDGLGLTPQEYSSLLNQLAAEARINADYYSRGGTVEELEQQFARLLGKESAVFLPTGTPANHVAVRKLAGENRRVLVQAESIFKISVAGIDPEKFLQRLRTKNIILSSPDKNTGAFWLTVNTTLNRISPEELANGFVRSAGA